MNTPSDHSNGLLMTTAQGTNASRNDNRILESSKPRSDLREIKIDARVLAANMGAHHWAKDCGAAIS